MTIKSYYYFARVDSKKEKISSVIAPSRLAAAKLMAYTKKLDLKSFLTIYSIGR